MYENFKSRGKCCVMDCHCPRGPPDDSSPTTDIYRKTNRGHGSQNQITH